MCSLILYLYYITRHYFCQVKIMLSPLGVVLRYTQGGLFWDKVCRIENEMAIFKMKMKCHFLWRCVLFFFVYTFAHFFCLIPIRIVLCYSFFVHILQKKYFFCFLSYSPLALDELIPHQRRAWNTVVIIYPTIVYHT